MNLYGYANGDPVNFSDPFGLLAMDCRKVVCPSITAIQNDARVRVAGEAMLRESMADGSERAAFLYNASGGGVRVGRVRTGSSSSGKVLLGKAPDNAIGVMHTHPPIRGADDFSVPGGPPSGDDAAYVRGNNIHGVVEERTNRYFQPVDRKGNYYTAKREPPIKP